MSKGSNGNNGNKKGKQSAQGKCEERKSNGKPDQHQANLLKQLFGQDLTPEQIAVIAALLTNTLSVDSVLLDKDQNVQIVLGGTLRQKTKMDQLLGEMKSLSIGDLLDSIKRL